jgi:transketolase
MGTSDVEELGINVIRGLAMDAPQRARSGHPGAAMALAPLADVLWTRVMQHDPSDPSWPDRDRFILSAGHASILLYSMLYLTGYGLELDDLQEFRQWGSPTPGHPEARHPLGVEVTTGPLGQGFANGVGMGITERWLRSRFGAQTTDHHIFVICSDGDLMEGMSHEAASIAGHLGLGRLIYVYDQNHISIDGATEITFTDDTARRFESYGWHVEELGDVANDTDALEAALRRGMEEEDRPSLLILRSHIAWPAPHACDTPAAHGAPLGEAEVRATKEILGLPPDETFWVPEEVLKFYRRCIPRGQALRQAWERRQDPCRKDAELLEAAMANRALKGWEAKLPTFRVGSAIATRWAINSCLNATVGMIPGLLSGAADLTVTTGANLHDEELNSRETPGGRQIAFGVRELGMGGAMNGMAMHGGVIPVGGTFFVFSDYARPAVRLAALSGAKVIWFFTHDSIGQGEDGPTHQPVEQLAAMRAMPQLSVIRPADANEVAQAWRVAVESDGPTLLVLTRQDVPVLEGTAERAVGLARGAYVLSDPTSPVDIVLVGTGSEVQLCLAAAVTLRGQGVAARVVSLPSWDLARRQGQAYLRSVFPPGVPRFGVEAAASQGWLEWEDAGLHLDRFGASAPGATAMANLGFTSKEVVRRASELLQSLGKGRRNQGGV